MFFHSHWGNQLVIFSRAAKSTDYRLEFKVNETKKSIKKYEDLLRCNGQDCMRYES